MSDSEVYYGSIVIFNNTMAGDNSQFPQRGTRRFTITHYVSNQTSCPISNQTIEPNANSSFGTFSSETGHDDHWLIETWPIGNGPLLYSSDKFKANFTPEDKDGTIIVSIYPDLYMGYGFVAQILFPQSGKKTVTLISR